MHARDFDRFLSRIKLAANGCWEWTATLRNGYGTMRMGGRQPYAHRAAYDHFIADLAPFVYGGPELDHLCRNTACCNPTHVELVPHVVNVERGEAGYRPHDEATKRKIGAANAGRPRPWTPEWRAKRLSTMLAAETCRNGHQWRTSTAYQSGRRYCRVCRLVSRALHVINGREHAA